MENRSVEIFSEATNNAIVRMPGRKFPGSVIQGDSLSILVNDARSVLDKLKNSDDEELVGTARNLVESLQSRLEHYEHVLAEHGIALPYVK